MDALSSCFDAADDAGLADACARAAPILLRALKTADHALDMAHLEIALERAETRLAERPGENDPNSWRLALFVAYCQMRCLKLESVGASREIIRGARALSAKVWAVADAGADWEDVIDDVAVFITFEPTLDLSHDWVEHSKPSLGALILLEHGVSAHLATRRLRAEMARASAPRLGVGAGDAAICSWMRLWPPSALSDAHREMLVDTVLRYSGCATLDMRGSPEGDSRGRQRHVAALAASRPEIANARAAAANESINRNDEAFAFCHVLAAIEYSVQQECDAHFFGCFYFDSLEPFAAIRALEPRADGTPIIIRGGRDEWWVVEGESYEAYGADWRGCVVDWATRMRESHGGRVTRRKRAKETFRRLLEGGLEVTNVSTREVLWRTDVVHV